MEDAADRLAGYGLVIVAERDNRMLPSVGSRGRAGQALL